MIELLYIFTINDKFLCCSYVFDKPLLINLHSAVRNDVCAFVELLGL